MRLNAIVFTRNELMAAHESDHPVYGSRSFSTLTLLLSSLQFTQSLDGYQRIFYRCLITRFP